MKWKTSIACLVIITLFAVPTWGDEPRDISKINKSVSFDMINEDVKSLLTMLTEFADLDVVFDECVQGRLNIKVLNVPLYEVFRIMLVEAGLDYEQEGDEIRITCQADKETTTADSDESMAFPGVRALVFASIKEKNKDEMEVLLPKIEREFTDSEFLLHPYRRGMRMPQIMLKTLDQNGRFVERPQHSMEIKFALIDVLPEGVEVKVSFSYTEELETDKQYAVKSYTGGFIRKRNPAHSPFINKRMQEYTSPSIKLEPDIVPDPQSNIYDQVYRTISGARQKLLTPSNFDEPILLFVTPEGDEYYLSVIPEEWSSSFKEEPIE